MAFLLLSPLTSPALIIFLEEAHEQFAGRGGVDADEEDHEDENCGSLSRGESEDLVREPDTDTRHEQATDYDPESQH
jgi:hypothetical protein